MPYDVAMRTLSEKERSAVRELLAELVGIDSAVTSHEQACRDRVEERMAAYLEQHLGDLGMTVDRHEVYPGRDNLIAHWPGQGGHKSLMLEAHMDTVTVEGMTIEPFSAEVRDNRMWGRGTTDTKGSMAAFLTAMRLAKAADALPADKLYFVAAMGEETSCVGSKALMKTDFRTDAAIVGEATSCRVVTAHKAPLWIELETRGRSCHASMPEQGINAVEIMSRIVQFIHGPWRRHLEQVEHPLLGRSTSQVTLIDGGAKVNIIPSSCKAQIDSRLIPGDPHEETVARFKQMMTDYLYDGSEFSLRVFESQPPLDCPPDTPFAVRLLDLCREATGQETPLGVNYFADSGPFSEAGIPSVIFGPGDIAQAHTADEFLDLDQLYLATEIILSLLTDNAGKSIVEAG